MGLIVDDVTAARPVMRGRFIWKLAGHSRFPLTRLRAVSASFARVVSR